MVKGGFSLYLFFLACCLTLLVRLLPFKLWRRLLRTHSSPSHEVCLFNWQLKLVEFVRGHPILTPFNCLVAATSGALFLKMFAIPCHINIGVQVNSDGRLFHAWLVWRQQTLLGWKKDISRFKVMSRGAGS